MDKDEFTAAMTGAIKAAERVAAVEKFIRYTGSGIGLAARIFALPAIAVYAWNGLTTLPDWHYWPAVAGFAVANVLIAALKGESK